ncbi:hypothetical protein WJX77_006674 [Trebouxia sp. C0004]
MEQCGVFMLVLSSHALLPGKSCSINEGIMQVEKLVKNASEGKPREAIFFPVEGGLFTGKTRRGHEMRVQLVKMAEVARTFCADPTKTPVAAGKAITLDFSGADQLVARDCVVSESCILGLRAAAKALLRCTVKQLRQIIAPEDDMLFILPTVSALEAEQQCHLHKPEGSSNLVLEMLTLDDLHLVEQQAVNLNYPNAKDLLKNVHQTLAEWMTDAQDYIGICVPRGVGIMRQQIGLADFDCSPQPVSPLTYVQSRYVIRNAVISEGFTGEAMDVLLDARDMVIHIRAMMGLPSLVALASTLLIAHMRKLGVLVGSQCGSYCPWRWLNPRILSISDRLDLAPCDDGGVQVMLQPLVQMEAIRNVLAAGDPHDLQQIVRDIQDAQLFPCTSSLAGDPLEKMIAVGLAAKMRLLTAGITKSPHRDNLYSLEDILPKAHCPSQLDKHKLQLSVIETWLETST